MIVTGTLLLNCTDSPRVINKGAIVVSRGRVTNCGKDDKITKRYPKDRILPLPDALLMPGLINAHTHLELPPLLDTIRDKSLPGWVLNLISAKKKLSSADYAAATRNNIRALIESGTTTVGEICTHKISPDILKESGLRAVIYHELISMNLASPVTRISSLAARRSSLMQTGISPHTPYTVSEAVLRQIKKITQDKKLPLSMHVAESKDEVRLLNRKKSGLEKIYRFAGWDIDWAPMAPSSFAYLAGIGLLSPRFLAVHAVHVNEEDRAFIKKTKAAVAHCPRSNKELNVGRMPLKKFLDAGIPVGLGTDSLASAPSLNMWDEMRYALQIHKKDGLTAQDIFKMATIGGAKALGLDKEIGTLEPGKKADIIAVPLPSKNTGDPYSDLLRETKSCIMTMVNGKILFRR